MAKKKTLETKVQVRKAEDIPKKERLKISSPPYGSSVSGLMKTSRTKKHKTPKRTIVK